MAYDEKLADRIRAVVGDMPGVTEKKMFGGLAFMLTGNMAVGVMADGLLVRVAREDFDARLTEKGAGPFVMGGRSSQGWLVVADHAIKTAKALEKWVECGAAYARSLPPK